MLEDSTPARGSAFPIINESTGKKINLMKIKIRISAITQLQAESECHVQFQNFFRFVFICWEFMFDIIEKSF